MNVDGVQGEGVVEDLNEEELVISADESEDSTSSIDFSVSLMSHKRRIVSQTSGPHKAKGGALNEWEL